MKNGKSILLYAALLFLVILALNYRVLNSYFIGDDFDSIGAAHDKSPRALLKLFYSDWWHFHPNWTKHFSEIIPIHETSGFLRPLVSISHRIEYLLYGTHPFGYHLTNVLLHFFNALFISLIANQIMGGHYPIVGFLVGLLFAVNPLRFETVGWISPRAELMTAFFNLSSFYLYIRYHSNKSLIYYVLSLLSFSLALFCKEIAIVFPMLIIGYDLMREFKVEFNDLEVSTNFFALVRKNIVTWMPYLITLAAYLVLRKVALGVFLGGYGEYHYQFDIRVKLSILTKFLNYSVFATHFRETVLPTPQEIASVLSLLGLMGFLLMTRYNHLNWRLLNFGILFFVIPYIPIFSYMAPNPWVFYLPVTGLSCILVAFLFSLPKKQISFVLSLLLIVFHASHQFKYNKDFAVAGSITKKVSDQVQSYVKNFREGDTIVLIDVPQTYATAWAFPLQSALESALDRPFADDLTKRFRIKQTLLYDKAEFYRPSLREVLLSAKNEPEDRVHFLRWNDDTSNLDQWRLPQFLDLRKAKIENPENVNISPVRFNKDTRLCLTTNSPSKITYTVTIDERLFLSFGIVCKSFKEDKVNGVLFEISADSDGKREKLFSKYFDPHNTDTSEKWNDHEIDLRSYRGKQVSLSFSNRLSKPEDKSDWYTLVGWGDVRLVSKPDRRQPRD